MVDSPVEFARNFQKLKSDLVSAQAPDLQLLLLLDFWPNLERHKNKSAYQTYSDEFIPLFSHLVIDENLADLTISELQNLHNTALAIRGVVGEQADDVIKTTSIGLAKKLFYVGETDKAFSIFEALIGKKLDISFEDLESQNEFDSFKIICERARHSAPELYQHLLDILIEWESVRESVHPDCANCLFVERSGTGTSYRGRLRALEGKVELFGRTAKTDEVTFHNQIKAPDDPFVGVAYDSLKAVRKIFKITGFRNKSTANYHAHFSILNSKQIFTGDSIGLAFSLIAYTQLLKPEVMRQERFISSEVAFTGGLDEDGRLLPVNKDTLALKLERAFFSPVKYLALPGNCLADAKTYLEDLSRRYPRRRLLLIGHEHLTDVIENRNVVRSEKVCMGVFVARKVAKYSRATKIQVPLMVGLLYLFVCLLFPKAWIGFDRNPEYVKLTKTGFVALNTDSIPLWSVNYECNTVSAESSHKVGDIDNDGNNEVAFVPKALRTAPCECDIKLFVYDDNGTLLFQRRIVILNEFVGDSTHDQDYSPSAIDFIKIGDSVLILTRAYKSFPARQHSRFWSSTGDSLGWYVNAGHFSEKGSCFSVDKNNRAMFLGFNNNSNCACFYVLDPWSSFGVAPVYGNSTDSTDKESHRIQIAYLLFPRTDLNLATQSLYNVPSQIVIESDSLIYVAIFEVYPGAARLSYYLDNDFRVIEVKADDDFILRRNVLVAEGKLPSIDWTTYVAGIRDSVTYWTDSGWVTEGQFRAAENF